MIRSELLEILACPETKEEVTLADQALVDKINGKIEAGELLSRGGEKIRDKIDAGLVRKDRKFLYAIREDIPIMLIEEAIPLEGI